MIELASPTPMMEPTKVWELEAGRPRYQVPRFQVMAEMRREKTRANLAEVPTLSTNSTGSKLITPKATAPEEVMTPIRFQIPDQTTAGVGFRVWV